MLKEEFESLVGHEMSISDYKIIEFVYTWHPAISETEGKKQMATLYTCFGMSVIIGMKEAAEYAQNIDTEISRLQSQIKDLEDRKEALLKGDFRFEQCLADLKEQFAKYGNLTNFVHLSEKYGRETVGKARNLTGI